MLAQPVDFGGAEDALRGVFGSHGGAGLQVKLFEGLLNRRYLLLQLRDLFRQ